MYLCRHGALGVFERSMMNSTLCTKVSGYTDARIIQVYLLDSTVIIQTIRWSIKPGSILLATNLPKLANI